MQELNERFDPWVLIDPQLDSVESINKRLRERGLARDGHTILHWRDLHALELDWHDDPFVRCQYDRFAAGPGQQPRV